MRDQRTVRLWTRVAPLWLALLAGPALALEGAAERGRMLYFQGTSAAGRPVEAVLPGGAVLPARVHPCGQCHQAHGRGSREAGLLVPDIRPATLGAPARPLQPGARPRGPYRPGDLARALRDGVDPAGRALVAPMPRYRMAEADMADLQAWLAVMGRVEAPGVTADRLRIGLLAPGTGRGAPVERLVRAWAARLERAGGIHGRGVDIVVRDPGPSEASALAAAAALARGPDSVVAVLAPAGHGAEPAVLRCFDAAGVPVVAPLGFAAPDDELLRVFRLLPDLPLQGRLLARALARRGRTADVVVAPGPAAAQVARGLRDEARRLGLRLAEVVDAARLPKARRAVAIVGDAAHVAQVLVVRGRDPADVLALLALVDPARLPAGPRPALLVPALGASRDHPAGRAFLDLLVETGDLPDAAARPPADLRSVAWAGAKVVEIALRAAGRDLTRERLVEALATIQGLDTGVMPAITFGRARRDGVRAALVVTPTGPRAATEVVDLEETGVGR